MFLAPKADFRRSILCSIVRADRLMISAISLVDAPSASSWTIPRSASSNPSTRGPIGSRKRTSIRLMHQELRPAEFFCGRMIRP